MTALGVSLLLAGSLARAEAPPQAAPPMSGPFGEFTERIRAAVDGYTVRATLGPTDTPLSLALSNFLLDHPDLSAFIVNRRRIAPYRIEERGPRRFWADDGAGTAGLVDLVERRETERVYFGEGVHRGRFLPPIRAAAVVVMVLRPEPGPDCRPRTRTYFHVYVRVENPLFSGLLKVLRPFLQKTVVSKFQRAFLVADKVGRLMAEDPASVAAEAGRFTPLPAPERDVLRGLMDRLANEPPSCAAASAPAAISSASPAPASPSTTPPPPPR